VNSQWGLSFCAALREVDWRGKSSFILFFFVVRKRLEEKDWLMLNLILSSMFSGTKI